ncbi:hypothetical protein [Lentilactobacillus parakefiri]|uniref:Uncharacterized protein n=1 Tax=Lentilactobacillus parakefiri TaxID=152332 RepID=A0A224VII4_9LACO|nr:hypothetical protein [Lentilactobacillus parakefiri]KRL51914.1 hypothetical protein FD08_GL000677 [Lentilactobacillus parakefiri DSM 10551]PAK99996.1 hypothetical protein B8W96_08885 [Lentilactobacillus parakefiri]TDG94769.1 hypothetical protein C5L28_000296 [Lentilactobacillus parakefiri]GAW72893.1 hypothetical protein LPKJCM_02025 [Lentilactobacillus parakefiri]
MSEENQDYQQQLEKLESGEIDKIEVKPESFMAFQTAYMNFDHRKRVIGSATEGGVITYVYDRDDKQKTS